MHFLAGRALIRRELNEKMTDVKTGHEGVRSYYTSKIDELEIVLSEKTQDLRRLEAQRNELNSKGMSTFSWVEQEPTPPALDSSAAHPALIPLTRSHP